MNHESNDWQGKIKKTDNYKVFNIITKEMTYKDNTGDFYQINAPDWVNVIAEKDEHILMIKQYRIGIDGYTLELPGGIIDDGESPHTAALRELTEETGYTGEAEVINWMHSNPALFTNKCYTARVMNIKKAPEGKSPEAFEDIESMWLPLTEIQSLIKNSHITNALTIASLMHYQLHLK